MVRYVAGVITSDFSGSSTHKFDSAESSGESLGGEPTLSDCKVSHNFECEK